MAKEFTYRWIFFFIGIMILGLGVSLTIKGQLLGVGAWDVLHVGLYNTLGLSIGSWSIILGVIIIVVSSIGLRELPKLGTFLNMLFVGLFIDFFNWLLPDPATVTLQVISFILGVLALAVGSGIYISAGPRDSLMLLIVNKLKLSMRVARTIMEVLVAVTGFLLGGPIGIGTVIMAFAIGPVMQIAFGSSKKLLDSLITEKQVSNY